MHRLAYEQLMKWKDNDNKKPLILNGIRQCGKTYLLKEFGQNNYSSVAYINFEKDLSAHDIFKDDIDPDKIITDLSLYLNIAIKPKETLIIFDEIQECGRALTSLKYFGEEKPEYDIVCAGSLLGILLSSKGSFPVGKVNRLDLYPMNFFEFLLANNENMLCEYLSKLTINDKLNGSIVKKLESYLREYYIVGGMPEAVLSWVEKKDVTDVDRILSSIISDYKEDFSKHAVNELQKLTLIWNYIPMQLAKENKKFIFGHAKKGARSKDLEDALQWLVDAGLVHKVSLIEKPSIPLKMYNDTNNFKLYLADVGILRVMSGYPPKIAFTDDPQYKDFKGSQAENYVLCEMLSSGISENYYWKDGRYEMEFLLQTNNSVIPVDVKAEKNKISVSMKKYRELYSPKHAIVVSMNAANNGDIIHIPLFLAGSLNKVINTLNNEDSE